MTARYFPTSWQISRDSWQQLQLQSLLEGHHPGSYQAQLIAGELRNREISPTASGGQLLLLGLLNHSLRLLAQRLAGPLPAPDLKLGRAFVQLFPPEPVWRGQPEPQFLKQLAAAGNGGQLTLELLLLAVQNDNKAARPYRQLFADEQLQQQTAYRQQLERLGDALLVSEPGRSGRVSLLQLLAEPLLAEPDNLAGQLRYIRQRWGTLLPEELLESFDIALASAEREFHRPGGGPGESMGPGFDDIGGHEPQAFSADADWMEHVVLLAKSTLVWLHQLSERYSREISRLDQVPEEELSFLAESGFNTLWLIGLWERSSASGQLKQLRGNPEAAPSAYALYDYQIAAELGGEGAFESLKQRCAARGIRLAGDVVPNHTGLYSRWIKEHPERYLQLDQPPYPNYSFNGPDLSPDPELGLFIEDGYYDHSDAAVVFKHLDRRNGRVRYIYHGNDGTHMPWNDTAQLDYLQDEVREAMARTIVAVAKRFPVIRFDAAMTLAKKHFQRLWYPPPGEPTAIPSRHEHPLSRAEFDRCFPVEFWRQVVDRVAAEAPDTLLLAEAFWLMESYFVRSLGMHRVYNSAFMNMLKREENHKFRSSLKETLQFNPEILKRFVNFMNNPDEATAVEQFGKGDKYFGVTVLLATMPGLPMFGHGQLEGLQEKYGMEYRRAYHDEAIDQGFLQHHRAQIFPLLRQRQLFSGAEHFQLFELQGGHGIVDAVYAYSNGSGSRRTLVLYNNSAQSVAGRLRHSVPKRQHGEHRPPETTSLLQALRLPEGGTQLVRYRNHRSGLWHLAGLEDWHRDGLPVALAPYEYAVLHEFAPVPATQAWLKLRRQLQGGGVADLEAALCELYLPRPTSRNRSGPLKIVLVASEVAPLAKTGGLADVAGSLPQALARLGHEVRIVMPHYPQVIPTAARLGRPELQFDVRLGSTRQPCAVLETRVGSVTTWLLQNRHYFDREQLYASPAGDYTDNAERFGFFCRALLQALPQLDFQPDVIHLNDWQTALIPLLLRTEHADDPFFAEAGTLLTIHNLGYQGKCDLSELSRLGLPQWLNHPAGVEFWGAFSFLKAGVLFADRINTVSATYAREILQPELGVGFDGLLRARGDAFSGILNGIDNDSWDPTGDPLLPASYSVDNLRGKARCKKALQLELGLQPNPDALVIAMVTRLDPQKGLDLVEAGWEELLQRPVQFVLLGSGEQGMMHRFATRADNNPRQVAVRLGFDDALSRRIYAGSDLFLMPSRYEPCGLGQLIALRYGCIPLVRQTGGLADTIIDLQAGPAANGFSFAEATTDAMLATIDRALQLFPQRRKWLKLVRSAMQSDYSWQQSALAYQELYHHC